MTKARILANLISDNAELADGQISVAEVVGAAPLASPTFTGAVTVPNITTTGDISFGDDDKAIFGAGSDLQIYHDGSNSFIKDTGVGNLSLLASTSINLINADSSKFMARFTDSGSNQFYFNGLEKLATTSTGVDVTGAVTATNFNFSTQPNYSSTSLGVYASGTFLNTSANTTGFLGVGGQGMVSWYTSGIGLAGAVTINEAGADADFRVESNSQTHALFVDAGQNKVGMNYSFGAAGAGEGSLTISSSGNGYRALAITNSTVNNANKGAIIGGLPYANANAMWTAFGVFDDNSNRTVYVGGGGWGVPEATQLIFYTAQAHDQINNSGYDRFKLTSAIGAVFNDPGYDYDFRIESNTNSYAFFVDASTGGIRSDVYDFTINNQDDGPALTLMSGRDYNSLLMGAAANYGSNNSSENKWSWNWRGRGAASSQHYNFLYDDIGNKEMFRVQADASQYAVVVNDGSHDHDFRVESNSFGHALFVDASLDIVNIATISDLGARLNVSNTSSSRNAIRAENNVANYNNYNVWSTFTSTGNINTTAVHFAGYTQSGNRFAVYGNGNVANTNNSYGSISDVRLKENIIDSGSQWDDIKALTVRKYSLKEDNLNAPNMLGVIAQEVESAGMGGLVYETPDRDQEGEFTGTSTKQVNYSILYMKAVKALQEAMDRIETLEAKVTALENA